MQNVAHGLASVVTWDPALLEPLAEINVELLGQMRAAVLAGGVASMFAASRAEWRELDASALRRLAAVPCLLLDVRFASTGGWQGVRDGGGRGWFADEAGRWLVHRALVFAWFALRTHRLMAQVMLGLSGESAARIGARSLSELESLSGRAPHGIAPQWQCQPAIWRQMVRAALRPRPEPLRAAQWRALALLAAERTPTTALCATVGGSQKRFYEPGYHAGVINACLDEDI